VGGGQLVVFLPGSLAAATLAVRESFSAVEPEADLRFHTAPTGLLATEVLAGARADVFVSANARYMETLRLAGLVVRPQPLAGNRLCIVVDPEGGRSVADVGDLGQPGLRVVTPPSATDPCGEYVVELFDRAGMTAAMTAKQAAGELFHSRGSADLPAYVTGGAAEAGVLYRSEAARLSGIAVVELTGAFDMSDVITFFIGAVGRTGPSPLAVQFVDFMTGPRGQRLLAGEGFLPAPPGGSPP
jgi:molybdate transport system substrate-binding protein